MPFIATQKKWHGICAHVASTANKITHLLPLFDLKGVLGGHSSHSGGGKITIVLSLSLTLVSHISSHIPDDRVYLVGHNRGGENTKMILTSFNSASHFSSHIFPH